ncbi:MULTISPECIES: phenylalanine 4-monooxygenase [unclassified Herbaspirillum]|uniref:phenylalanine 4-monooxygenase n=1 Tax=unclassified Herbaspirillum TaxID=2624150 RepID=UPI000E2EE803|nr:MULTISPECIES: phenylalanine 4-monooxygenase [unclassified Herbaspirillum]RFB71024.1 phenylalanine 4-monooxygenase [Herbaspirillum sp. 3R-3a1]TFI08455.1 phenylalanine 4-monooxygenase [Herbaspirillum sp. 3R11]TFI14870.1 phenylalanine 4-monooxygenase [Herbaspirillum sp. 3R-11]TFI30337.1 phenylalanine 4-monooxygenase [Herbaspirillum sp. 3C11]
MNNSASTDDFFASVAAKSDSGALRGDYSNADKNFVVDQNWTAYTPAQHALWRRLYERQARLIPGRACDVFLDSIKALDVSQGIPQFDRTTEALYKATGWQLVAVPGLVPDHTFFEHLANRRFPVTVWLREESEFDYIVEPDVFHDFFGHVPLLFNPVFAEHLQEYGKGGLKALKLDGLAFLARLYWYTIEFGLIQSPEGLRIYGAGILSSGGEVDYALRGSQNLQPNRIPFQVERVMRTLYKIDSYQETYFVIRDFQQLFDDTAPDFTALYEQLKVQDALPANMLLPGEQNLPIA